MQNTLIENSLEYKCMDRLIKPLIFVDGFEAKMGDSEDIIVISFYIKDERAAHDLLKWFEAYEWVLDADCTPGEVKPNRYLIFVELRRRLSAGKHIYNMLHDLDTLTDLETKDWRMRYEGEEYPFSIETFDKLVPLSPHTYREKYEKDLNEWRIAAGLDTKNIFGSPSEDINQLQIISGIT